MKKRIMVLTFIMALFIVMLGTTGCNYSIEFNWPVQLHKITPAPEQTPWIIYIPPCTPEPTQIPLK